MNIQNTIKMIGEYGPVFSLGSMLLQKAGRWTARQNMVENWLERRYGNIPDHYAQCPSNCSEASQTAQKVLWTLWLGERVPEVAVQTMQIMHKRADGYQVRTLTEADVPQLLDIPGPLWDKYRSGKIRPVHFSDIVRIMLLRRYGGIWLDATVLMTKPLPKAYFERDFMSCRTDVPDERFPANGRWCGFLLGAGQTNTVLFSYMEEMYLGYWKEHDVIVDYLLMDDLLDIGCRRIPAVARAIAEVPVNNPQFHALSPHLHETYNEDLLGRIGVDTFLHHLSWKGKRAASVGENSYYCQLLTKTDGK